MSNEEASTLGAAPQHVPLPPQQSRAADVTRPAELAEAAEAGAGPTAVETAAGPDGGPSDIGAKDLPLSPPEGWHVPPGTEWQEKAGRAKSAVWECVLPSRRA
jgi:hypothetical protein